MAWAQETKNLIAEIKTGHRDRAVRIGEIKSATKDILSDADAYMKQVAADLKEAAKNLRDFLAKSEETRKRDFDVLYRAIQTRIRDIKGDVKDFLSKSEEKRMVDFKALMKDVTGAVEAIENATKTLLGNYKAERKEAAGYWARLGAREEAAPAEEAAPRGRRKRGRPKK